MQPRQPTPAHGTYLETVQGEFFKIIEADLHVGNLLIQVDGMMTAIALQLRIIVIA
jgi:hypothetical protein